jgi:dTMP kinase
MSLFITFEGGEGCGKSTQSRRLYHRLLKQDIPALLVHEPGVTSLGKKVRRLLKWSKELNISPLSELLLFNAARVQLVTEVVKPALRKGMAVICDRFADSTLAYQGYGHQLDLTMVDRVNKIGMQGLIPDLTALLDMPIGDGLTRKKSEKPDRFEKLDRSFHERVRKGYLKLAAAEPERWLVINAAKSREEIAVIVWQRVSRLINNRQGT